MRCLAQASRWGADHVAVGVVACRAPAVGSPSGLPTSSAGLAPVQVGSAGDTMRSFGWASVTKLVTTLAVLVAAEEATLSLDDLAGPPGSTLAHLLAHASGLSPDDPSRVLAPPGTRRIYSNAGIEEAAAHLERCSAMPFVDYLAGAVLEPLEMGSCRLVGSPAHGLEGTLGDLLRLGAELLVPRLVHPDTLHRATSVAFPHLSGVLPGFGRQDPCDFGLGFELKDTKAPHWTGSRCSPATFGHFGQSGAFLWVDPVARVACGGLCDRPFGPWAAEAWPALADDVLAELDSDP